MPSQARRSRAFQQLQKTPDRPRGRPICQDNMRWLEQHVFTRPQEEAQRKVPEQAFFVPCESERRLVLFELAARHSCFGCGQPVPLGPELHVRDWDEAPRVWAAQVDQLARAITCGPLALCRHAVEAAPAWPISAGACV